MKVDAKSFLLGCVACVVGMGGVGVVTSQQVAAQREPAGLIAPAQASSTQSVPAQSAEHPSSAEGGSAQQRDAQTHRVAQFENDDVKVWKTTVLPNAPLTMHRHEHPRVIIALRGGMMQIVDDKGATESHPWETGNAYWLPANPPGTMHADVNKGAEPIEVMVVELKKEP